MGLIDWLFRDIEEHFNTTRLGAAGRFLGYDEELKAFVLYAHTGGWDKLGEVADKAYTSIPPDLKERLELEGLGFVVKPI